MREKCFQSPSLLGVSLNPLFGLVLGLLLLSSSETYADADHYKIVNYWSLWCGPCRVEIPELNLLSEELEPYGIDVLGVNFDEDPRDKTLKIADRMGIKFKTLNLEEVRMLGLDLPSVLPTTYILDSENQQKAKLVGAQSRESLLAVLKQLNVQLSNEKEANHE